MIFYKTNVRTCPEVESEVEICIGDIVYIGSWNYRCFEVSNVTDDSIYLTVTGDMRGRREILVYPTDETYYV